MQKKQIAIFLPVLLALAILLAPLSYGSAPGNAGIALLIRNIPADWEAIAIIVTLITITAAALVFALAGTINSPTARTWSRMQIYEALLSIAILLIFSFFAYLFLINPQHAFGAIGLLPSQCSGNNVFDIFTLATCDLSTFNNDAFSLAGTLYKATYYLGFAPGFSVTTAPLPAQPYIKGSAELPSILAPSIETSLSLAFNGILAMLVLNQVQLLLISASMLFLFVFFALGIIARTFGFSRSFGGVLIAFALGLGLIYPILVSLTYGFISVQLNIYPISSDLGTLLLGLISPIAQTSTTVLTTLAVSAGYYVAGLTFIPFLNFLILDAFIVDFSKSIGEKIDFMSLLSGLV